MSRKGLELLKDLSEINDAVSSLDNLCTGAAQPFNSSDFRVFTSNKRNTSTFTFIPNNYTSKLSSYGGSNNEFRLEIAKQKDVDRNIVNLNISVNDIVYGEGLQPNTVIERIDVYGNESNILGLPKTELVLTKALTADILIDTEFTLKKQNNATIDTANNLFVLGDDTYNHYYEGDKITLINYPLSTSDAPILGTGLANLFIVEGAYNVNNQFSFGLSLNEKGSKINLSSVNSLCAINIYRSNEVTATNFRNVFLPDDVDYIDSDPSTNSGINADSRTFYSLETEETVNNALTKIEQSVDYTGAVLSQKISLVDDNITNKDINIQGTLRVADPGLLNKSSGISDNIKTPSIYILDPETGSLNQKVRIFSTFDSPWDSTSGTLSSNKNINVDSLTFDKNLLLNTTIQPITPTSVSFNRKIPIYVEDSDGLVSTYFLLASAQS